MKNIYDESFEQLKEYIKFATNSEKRLFCFLYDDIEYYCNIKRDDLKSIYFNLSLDKNKSIRKHALNALFYLNIK